jgi:hypothetical protein
VPAITVRLDKKRAARLARWAPIETAADLLEWVDASGGKGLGLAQRKA